MISVPKAPFLAIDLNSSMERTSAHDLEKDVDSLDR
eukprot:CAMPEP_0169206202 /NCGR_PEP_ID=MMETSP1016-20121227/12917_1 /TAXON_ID=342587 /ORGANISM="Karlodinium micrum, Strain CCMP2283" /LENGTH=35 /DNA_ID= /DNA_START= /DNA_END= /DNA_ORIENTATION=